MQLDLLSYVLTSQEVAEPPAADRLPPNPHAIAYHQAAAALYLRLMSNFMNSDRLPILVKRHEITRLHQLRQQALAKVKELGA